MRRMAVDASITILAAAGQNRLDVRTEILLIRPLVPGSVGSRFSTSRSGFARSAWAERARTSGIAAGFASTVLMSFSWSAPGFAGNFVYTWKRDAAAQQRCGLSQSAKLRIGRTRSSGSRARAKRSLLGPKKTICSISLPIRL